MSDPNVLPSPEDPRQAAAEHAGSVAVAGVDPVTADWYRRMLTEPDDPEINAAAEAAPAVGMSDVQKGEASRWAERQIAFTKADLARSGGTETKYVKIPPK